mmetsp:Transcript_169095/g.543494  ORF Transcript_169095/g.543494 Transcript_169095/m.543494 type:complete len:244 (+) Transcript_169095:2354-3085(+)
MPYSQEGGAVPSHANRGLHLEHQAPDFPKVLRPLSAAHSPGDGSRGGLTREAPTLFQQLQHTVFEVDPCPSDLVQRLVHRADGPQQCAAPRGGVGAAVDGLHCQGCLASSSGVAPKAEQVACDDACQNQETLDELLQWHPRRKAGSRNSDRLNDASAAQLLKDHDVVDLFGRLVLVWLDAPHVLRVGFADGLHELFERVPELRGDSVSASLRFRVGHRSVFLLPKCLSDEAVLRHLHQRHDVV